MNHQQLSALLFDYSLQCFLTTGKCLLYEGYLQHQSVQNSFVTTVGLSKKGAEWLAQNSRCKNAAPSCQLVPSSDLLAELHTAAVKEIPSTSSGLVWLNL